MANLWKTPDSMLAIEAGRRCSAPCNKTRDGALAGRTGHPSPAIDSVLGLCPPSFATERSVVCERGSAGLDGPPKHFLDRRCQSSDIVTIQGQCRATRIEPGLKERFIGVDVADAGYERLVKQRRLDGAACRRQPLRQLTPKDRRGSFKCVGAEACPMRFECRQRRKGPQPAKAPRIAEAHTRAIVKFPDRMDMCGQRGIDIRAELPGHSQVDLQAGSAVANQGERLAVTADRYDAASLEERSVKITCQARRIRARAAWPENIRAKQVDRSHPPPDKLGLEGAPDGFDFRKFGHGAAYSNSNPVLVMSAAEDDRRSRPTAFHGWQTS